MFVLAYPKVAAIVAANAKKTVTKRRVKTAMKKQTKVDASIHAISISMIEYSYWLPC